MPFYFAPAHIADDTWYVADDFFCMVHKPYTGYLCDSIIWLRMTQGIESCQSYDTSSRDDARRVVAFI